MVKRARADYSGVGTREEPSQGDRDGGAGEAGGGRNTRGGRGVQKGGWHSPQNRLQQDSLVLCVTCCSDLEMDFSELGKLEVIGNHGGCGMSVAKAAGDELEEAASEKLESAG